jgi:hypothetical protein
MDANQLAAIHPFKLCPAIEAARKAARTAGPEQRAEALALVAALEGEWRRRQLAEIARRAAEPVTDDSDLFDRCAE